MAMSTTSSRIAGGKKPSSMLNRTFAWGNLPELLIVLMRRPIADIIASQERIGWAHEAHELGLFGLGSDDGPIAKVKYDWWEKNKHLLSNRLEIEYDSLAGHVMWLPADQRKDFTPKQTRPGQTARVVRHALGTR